MKIELYSCNQDASSKFYSDENDCTSPTASKCRTSADQLQTVESLFCAAPLLLSRLAAQPTVATSLHGMYGENTLTSVCRALNLLRCSFGLDQDSVLLDIGSGRGLPNLAAALLFGVKASIGVEIDRSVWQLSKATYASVLEHAARALLTAPLQLSLPRPAVRALGGESGGSSLGVAFGLCDASELLSLEPATHVFTFDLAMPQWVVRRIVVLFNASRTSEIFVTFRKDLLELGMRAVPVAQTVMTMAGSGERHRVIIFAKPSFIRRKINRKLQRKRYRDQANLSPIGATAYRERQEKPRTEVTRISLKHMEMQADSCDSGACAQCGQCNRLPFKELRDAWFVVSRLSQSREKKEIRGQQNQSSVWEAYQTIGQTLHHFFQPPFLFLPRGLAMDEAITSVIYDKFALTVAEAIGSGPDAEAMTMLGSALRSRASTIDQMCMTAALDNDGQSSNWDCFLNVPDDPDKELKNRFFIRKLFYQSQLPVLVQLEYLSAELAAWWVMSDSKQKAAVNDEALKDQHERETRRLAEFQVATAWGGCKCPAMSVPCITPGGSIIFH